MWDKYSDADLDLDRMLDAQDMDFTALNTLDVDDDLVTEAFAFVPLSV